MAFWSELKRRNVFKVGVAYAVVAWLVAQIAGVFAPALSLPDWVTRLVVFLLILGFPVALVLAWAYELTPSGIKKTRDVPLERSIRHLTGQKHNYFVAGALAAAIVFLALDRYVLDEDLAESPPRPVAANGPATEGTEEAQNSIVVLPFANISSDPEQEYFADGLSEELTNSLAQIHDLRVAGRTSAFYFKGRNEDLRTIGETLGVEHILEGSVRRGGDQVRITAQLVNARTGFHLWSQTYDRELDDIFAIQGEISRAVAEALQITLGVGELGGRPGMTRNFAAYDEYLLAMAARRTGTIREAINHFERAIALDPNFALAWIELSTAYRIGVAFTPDAPHDEWSMKATEALFRARELAPESHYILTIEAGNHAQAWGNWREAGRIFAAMLASAPTAVREPGVSMMNGRILYLAGKPGAAVGALEHAKSLDPLSIEVALDLARAYASSGDLTAALTEGARAAALPGANAYTSAVDLWTTLSTGDTARADTTLDALEAAGILSHSVRLGRLREDAAAARTEITRLAADSTAQAPMLADLAMWSSYYGDFDLALDLFRRPVFSGENAFIINYSVWSPLMEGARRLPAFRELMRDHGLVPYWREYGWSDFCRPTTGDDFECDQ